MKYRKLAPALACMLLLCGTVAYARPPSVQSATSTTKATSTTRMPRPTSLEQAVREVQHRTHGRILAANTVRRGSSDVYRIKVLTAAGEVRVLQLRSKSRKQSASNQTGFDESDNDHGGF